MDDAEPIPRIHQRNWHTVTSDARLAGDVTRFHTFPTLRQQTVAHHCWNAARILLAIWPDAPRHVIVELLFHDNGELAVGDTPGHAKREHPKLAAALDIAENEARLRQCLPWGMPPPQNLTEDELRISKLCDVWECWEEALMERLMGNKLADYVIDHCFIVLANSIPCVEDVAVVRRAMKMLKLRKAEWAV